MDHEWSNLVTPFKICNPSSASAIAQQVSNVEGPISFKVYNPGTASADAQTAMRNSQCVTANAQQCIDFLFWNKGFFGSLLGDVRGPSSFKVCDPGTALENTQQLLHLFPFLNMEFSELYLRCRRPQLIQGL
jgi:hypothetical protein